MNEATDRMALLNLFTDPEAAKMIAESTYGKSARIKDDNIRLVCLGTERWAEGACANPEKWLENK